jgi:membrane-bound lytic murein transglycosylase B
VRSLLALLFTGAALGGLPAPSRPAATPAVAPAPLPAPDAPLPRTAGRLAADFAATTRALRVAQAGWHGAGPVPRRVTYLALHQQRIVRLMSAGRGLGDAALDRLPGDVRGEARDAVRGERWLAAIPRSPGPPPRVGPAAPAARLRRYYAVAQRRYGVPWSVLAAVNFVESQFGRLRNASEAGARGPMQFMPATWREYGQGGDIEDPHDAILAAAGYLRRAGAPHDLDAALFAYNHSRPYVRAIRRFAHRMRTDARVFLTYYAWQVYAGGRRLTGPTGTRAAEAFEPRASTRR